MENVVICMKNDINWMVCVLSYYDSDWCVNVIFGNFGDEKWHVVDSRRPFRVHQIMVAFSSPGFHPGLKYDTAFSRWSDLIICALNLPPSRRPEIWHVVNSCRPIITRVSPWPEIWNGFQPLNRSNYLCPECAAIPCRPERPTIIQPRM